MVAYLIALTALFLCLLRAYWRHSLYRRYERGLDTRNVLIVGASHVGSVMRNQIVRNGHLGRSFKGFLQSADAVPSIENAQFVVGDLRQAARLARQHFIDEIIIAERCPTPVVIELVEMARELDVEVLVVPGFYDELTPEAPIEYFGDFPVVALHRRNGKVVAHLFKRIWDFGVSATLLILLLPTLSVIALLIKLSSPGPVLYRRAGSVKKAVSFIV